MRTFRDSRPGILSLNQESPFTPGENTPALDPGLASCRPPSLERRAPVFLPYVRPAHHHMLKSGDAGRPPICLQPPGLWAAVPHPLTPRGSGSGTGPGSLEALPGGSSLCSFWRLLPSSRPQVTKLKLQYPHSYFTCSSCSWSPAGGGLRGGLRPLPRFPTHVSQQSRYTHIFPLSYSFWKKKNLFITMFEQNLLVFQTDDAKSFHLRFY